MKKQPASPAKIGNNGKTYQWAVGINKEWFVKAVSFIAIFSMLFGNMGIGTAVAAIAPPPETPIVAPTPTTNTIVVRPANFSFPSAWYFYDDTADIPHTNVSVGNYEMVTGPSTPPQGSDSVEMTVSGTTRTNIATAQFNGVDLSALTSLGFSTYEPAQLNVTNRAVYLNFDVDFDTTVAAGYAGRLVYVPADNGSVLTGTWQNWSTLTGQWRWSRFISNGNVWPDGNTNELRSWNDIKTAFPNSEISGQMLLRAGEPYNDGFKGNTDAFVIGFNNNTTTYDFEKDIPKTPITVTVNKVWQDADGNIVDGPDNKDDITIVVEDEQGDPTTCTYDDGELVCTDPTIAGNAGEPLDVTETGVPAGWQVVSGTVGAVVPTCPEESTNCTITVINKQETIKPCGTELVANGGFELPEVTDPAGWHLYPSGTDTLGWSVDEANSSTNANLEIQENVAGSAHGGNQLTELDTDQSVRIYQNLNTKVGGVYTVKFWTSPRPGQGSAQNRTEFQFGNEAPTVIEEDGSANSNTVWTEHVYSFTATDTLTRVSFRDLGASNSYGGYLDDVSVVENCISDVTICKVDNNQNPLSGWEVYLKGDVVDSVEVPGNTGSNVLSGNLPAGDYLLEASGTYVYRGDPNAAISDAAFSKRLPSDPVYSIGTDQPWVPVNDFPTPYEGWLGIQVDEANNFNWGTSFNSTHEYSGFKNLASAGNIKFRILDDNYSDNSGSLTVDIRPVYKAVTGKDGCATLENVPYDTYKLDETMKDGWSNVSGKDTTKVVDGPTESFTLVNRCDDNCKSVVTICKQDDGGHPLAGWTVYLKGPKLETVTVNSANINGTDTVNNLTLGQNYLAEISGEWQNRGFETVDASFTTPDSWVTPLEAPIGGWPDALLETQINNSFVNWGDYSSTHNYSLITTGTGGQSNFAVFDGNADTNVKDAGWYGDNIGSLTVNIYPVYSGVTEKGSGCATIENVPYGNYKLGEVMQSGWTNVSGMGDSVVVNEPTEPGVNSEENPFTLVNECNSETCEVIVPCVDEPIGPVVSGINTFFEGLKEGGSAPVNLSNSAWYPMGTQGNAVLASPTGYPGAWNGSLNDPAMTGAVFVSNDAIQPTNPGAPGHNGAVDSWRLFSHTFTVPAGAINISTPVLRFAADNEVTAFLDNSLIGFNNNFGVVTSSAPLTLTPGTHTLEFAVKNYAFEPTNNPTGVIYKLDAITFDCPSSEPDTGSLTVNKVTVGGGEGGETFGFNYFHQESESGGEFTISTPKESSYTIPNLDPGTYNVDENELPTPWQQTGNTCLDVEVVANETATCTITNTYGYSISGKVYHDNNPQNGVYDPESESSSGEAGLSGWSVYVDIDEDNTQDVEEPTGTSDENGDYSITGLFPGCYTVRESVQNDWDQTGPNVSEFEYQVSVGGLICGDLVSSVTGLFFKTAHASALDATGKDFGNVESSSGGGSSSGSKIGGGSGSTPGRVLGDSTTVPSSDPAGQVLGASTTLPRTGSPAWFFLLVVILAAPMYNLRKFTFKKQ